jgi:hypothetical protein
MLTAKNIVTDKFWIVEQDGSPVATIQTAPDGVVLVRDQQREKFPSISVLKQKYNIIFNYSRPAIKLSAAQAQQKIYGFPTATSAYNILYDVKLQLPVYTQEPDSKCYFCAGYYIINTKTGWELEFNPKLIMLNRYDFQGPFVSESDAQSELHRVAHK